MAKRDRGDVFDFQMKVFEDTNHYDNEAFAHCSITYPQIGEQKPIYKSYESEWTRDAIDKAIEDLHAFLYDPDAWVHKYIMANTSAGYKVSYAKQQLHAALLRIERAKDEVAFANKDVQKYRKDVEQFTLLAQREADSKKAETK